MLNASQINLKVCGITSSKSIKIAAGKNIRTLGFASSNLHGPNTCNDKKLKDLIEECNEYKIEAVLLSKYQSTYELIKQIDYTKPKTIACSYFYDKSELKKLKKIFKRLRIGISINPERFDFKYFKSIANLVNVFYYDLNVYSKNNIKTFSINDCRDQIMHLKTLHRSIYIGGGINNKNVETIIKSIQPYGIDISRGLKDIKNNLCENKLNKLLKILSNAA
tara:strand:- start:466 stop:1128 length:663 start_codon:yes stop_codon:yes gene_type:complete